MKGFMSESLYESLFHPLSEDYLENYLEVYPEQYEDIFPETNETTICEAFPLLDVSNYEVQMLIAPPRDGMPKVGKYQTKTLSTAIYIMEQTRGFLMGFVRTYFGSVHNEPVARFIDRCYLPERCGKVYVSQFSHTFKSLKHESTTTTLG